MRKTALLNKVKSGICALRLTSSAASTLGFAGVSTCKVRSIEVVLTYIKQLKLMRTSAANKADLIDVDFIFDELRFRNISDTKVRQNNELFTKQG